jgi:hypothetical protein
MAAGAVLMIVLMARQQVQPSPVEIFAKGKAGKYYMPHKTDLDYFEVYQKPGELQVAGVALKPNNNADKTLYIDHDATITQHKLDGTGHCVLYLRVDEEGRAQFGAPLVDADGKTKFLVLGVDGSGNLVAQNAADGIDKDPKVQWRAEIQGGAEHVMIDSTSFLKSAPFKLYNEDLFKSKGEKWYLATKDSTGWQVSKGDGTTVSIEMTGTGPQNLKMADIAWSELSHDRQQMPSLGGGSQPLSWSLSPQDLPANVKFNSKTGAIFMDAGKDDAAADEKTYTLTVSNPLGSSRCRMVRDRALALGPTIFKSSGGRLARHK